MSTTGLAVLLFTAITLGIGFWSYYQIRGKAINYYKAGAAMPFWVIGITLCAQAFDANGSMGAVSLSYSAGFWAGASIPVGLASCLFLTGFVFAKPIQKMNLMTLPDFYHRRYSKKTETLAAISMLASNIVLIAGNLAGLGLLYSLVFGVPYLPMLIVIAVLILAYATTGGFVATISTSVFQVAVFVVGMLLAFFWLTSHFGWDALMLDVPSEHKYLTGLTSLKHGALLNWAALISLGVGDVVAIDFIQRVIASDSPETARKGCFMGGALTLAVGIPTAFIGLYAFHLNGVASKQLLVDIAINNVPETIGILLILGIIGASMSTAAGVILDLANVITRNLVQRNMKTKWSDHTMLKFSRLIAIPTMISAVVISYIWPEPGTLLILAFDIVLAGCFIPLCLGIYWKKANTMGAISSIVSGAICRLTLYFTIPESLAGLDTLLSPLVSGTIFVVVSLATQKTSPPLFEAIHYVPTEEELVSGDV
jgi:solute:Na+ symporter, SSS family